MTKKETIRNLLTELIDMIDNGSQRDLDRVDEISKTILEIIEKEPCCNIKALEQQPSDETIKYLECNDIDVQKFTEAMKKQPLQVIKTNICDDCVSRQAVLDKKVLIELPDGQSFYCISPEDVEPLPPVTPTQSWIPVSERLPTKNERVLVNQTIDNRNVVYCTRFPFEKTKVEYITAWQPLPKPYEEKRGNENG